MVSRGAAREFMQAAPFNDYSTYGYGRFACVWRPTTQAIGFSGIKYVPEIAENELGWWPWFTPRTSLPRASSPSSASQSNDHFAIPVSRTPT